MYSLIEILNFSKDQLLKLTIDFNLEVGSEPCKPDLQKLILSYLTENHLLASEENLFNSKTEPVSMDLEMRKLEIRERELDFEKQKCEKQLEFEREQREKDRDLRRLELEFQSRTPPASSQRPPFSFQDAVSMLPPFNEKEVENFFDHFEKLASSNGWPLQEYVNIILCKISGKARNALLSLPTEEVSNYEIVKSKILEAFHVTAERLRLRFRSLNKKGDETHLEFMNRKAHLLDKWLREADVSSFEDLRNLLLIEEFHTHLSNDLQIYFVDKSNLDFIELAKLADAYALSVKPHKAHFKNSAPSQAAKGFNHNVRSERSNLQNTNNFNNRNVKSPARTSNNSNINSNTNTSYHERFCSYCKSYGHTIDYCYKRQNHYRFTSGAAQSADAYFESRRNSSKRNSNPPTTDKTTTPSNSDRSPGTPPSLSLKDVALHSTSELPIQDIKGKVSPVKFNNFIYECFCQPLSSEEPELPLFALRDTGCSVSLLLKGTIPDHYLKSLDGFVLITGVVSSQSVPLYSFMLNSPFGKQEIVVGLIDNLPVQGVSLLLGNEFLGSRVRPTDPIDNTLSRGSNLLSNKNSLPIIMCTPYITEISNDIKTTSLPECAVTRSQSKQPSVPPLIPLNNENDTYYNLQDTFFSNLNDECNLSKEHLIKSQQDDSSLSVVRKEALSYDSSIKEPNCYYIKNDILMRKWTPLTSPHDASWAVKHQIVVPRCYRDNILKFAHDIPTSGHLGVSKTLTRIYNYFYWPGIRASVSHYVRTCSVCQRVGKPNQKVPIAPLIPIPILDPPFTRVLCDIVGPLPPTTSDNCCNLTLLDISSRFPAAFSLSEVSSSTIANCFIEFFSNFGICKEIQFVQGTNFMSTLIQEVSDRLLVENLVSCYDFSSLALTFGHCVRPPDCLILYCCYNFSSLYLILDYLVRPPESWLLSCYDFYPLGLIFGPLCRPFEYLLLTLLSYYYYTFCPSDLIFSHLVRPPEHLLFTCC